MLRDFACFNLPLLKSSLFVCFICIATNSGCSKPSTKSLLDLSSYLTANGHHGTFTLRDPSIFEEAQGGKPMGLIEYGMLADIVDGKIQSFACTLHRFDTHANAKAFAERMASSDTPHLVNGPFVLASGPVFRGNSQLPYAFSQFSP
jgi:hypothetical protein